MNKSKPKNLNFNKGLLRLGFYTGDDCLYLTTEQKKLPDPQVEFHLEKAKEFEASAVYLRKQLNGSYKPQAYLYDYTGKGFQESELTEIQKIIWSSGEAPLACIFYDTEIKILDCTIHITNQNTPVYLAENLQLIGEAHTLYNEQFAVKIKSGIFWEEAENKTKFKFQNSSYDKLIKNIVFIVEKLKNRYKNIADEFINKIIIQSILIKYLEERIDDDGNKLLSGKFFKKYDKAATLNDVLRKKGKFVELLVDLNNPKTGFNGNVFEWSEEEKKKLKNIDLAILADLLESKSSLLTGQLELWRYFEFKYIPVELISRLYEEFLGTDKKDNGLFYTPSHLAKLLVDECLPLKKFKDFDLENYKVLDPACGSGIFMVIAFKRLVQIWRLQNEMALPELPVLKKLLRNIYGVDKEKQAVRLASFSLCLALCNELKPIDIINKLKFDDLREENVIESDFFNCEKLKNKKFNLIIGNPPFNRGAITKYSQQWEYKGQEVKIPQGQIALKFLSESLRYLVDGGLQCLIIKSSGLLYNTTSEEYKKLLFSSLNVVQVLDFTGLARNKALWDNGADVASAAIFIKNEKPDLKKNLLHLTFRRTKATKERISFEIDDYDLHFINRQTAIDNNFIWKNNLLGGGRVKSVVEKFATKQVFNDYLSDNNLTVGEGYIIGIGGKLKPKYIFNMPTLPTEAITEDGIDYSQLTPINKNIKFVKVPEEVIFKTPNILIWENIGDKKLPVFYNQKALSFKDKIIGIGSKNPNASLLKSIVNSFDKNSSFYRFYIYAMSSQVLINLNTAILKTDIMQLPFISADDDSSLTHFDKSIISDVNEYMQDFLRHGEYSEAVKSIAPDKLNPFISKYGREFSSVLNLIYKSTEDKFRLSDVIMLDNSFIATVFKYDNKQIRPVFHADNSKLNLAELSNHKISEHLSVNRIIKLYPQEDTIIFIKPNQQRYWLSLIAYRDADKCFSDLVKLGY
jgi:methylase of polypeptide subunit release factors